MKKNTKIISLSFLACAVFTWVFFRNLIESIWVFFKFDMPVGWLVAPADVVGIVAAVGTFILLSKISKIRNFTDDVINELSKVTWPERKETVLSTGVIAVMVGIASLILLAFDVVWGTLVKVVF